MILIAGATGFLGRYLCPLMVKQNMNILALGRSKSAEQFFKERSVPFQYFDYLDEESYKSLPRTGVKCVLNLGAILAELESPVEKMFQVNTIGTYKLLEYCREVGVKKFIQASSHKVYNDLHHIPLRITDTPSFAGDHSPYIISKLAAENFVQYYAKDFDIHGIILRFTGLHGYGEILGHLSADGSYKKSTFELFVEQAKKGEPLEVWGDGETKRDHLYVKDALTAIINCVASEKADGIYNVASGEGVTLLEEAEAIAKVFSPAGKTSPVIRKHDKPAFTRSYVYDIEKTKRDFNWAPQYSLEEMLIDYAKEQVSREYCHYHFIKEGQRPATY